MSQSEISRCVILSRANNSIYKNIKYKYAIVYLYWEGVLTSCRFRWTSTRYGGWTRHFPVFEIKCALIKLLLLLA